MDLLGKVGVNCFRTHNELTSYPQGKCPLPPVRRDRPQSVDVGETIRETRGEPRRDPEAWRYASVCWCLERSGAVVAEAKLSLLASEMSPAKPRDGVVTQRSIQ